MSRDRARATEEAVLTLLQQCEQNPHLHAELQRARRQFFGAEPHAGTPGAAGEHRFAEWFVLERDSEVLGSAPVDVPALAGRVGELLGSTAGVFLVTAAGADGVEARDLQDDDVLELAVPADTLRQGDLLVGRLFAGDGEPWVPSSAAAVFRPGEQLGLAFQRDLARLDLGRRLQQVELEHLLLRRADQAPSPTAKAPIVPLEHLEADLDRLLRGGDTKHTAAAISGRLAEAASPGAVMGPLLDELAFDTAVDLDRARVLLLQIWNAYHPGGEPEAEPERPVPGETLGERLVRTLDEGLAQRRDVTDVFAQLERIAGLPPGAADEDAEADDEAAEPAAGDLGPLVQEYLWETGREHDDVASLLHMWVDLQGNSALPRTDLELVTGQDLMRFLLHVYLGAPPAARADEVRAAFRQLQEFYAWAARTQELDLEPALRECRGALLDQLDRLAAASARLSGPANGALQPRVLQVEDLGERGFGVRDDEGGDHWLDAEPAASASLRKGDLVVGALVPRGAGRTLAGPVVVLPADARALME